MPCDHTSLISCRLDVLVEMLGDNTLETWSLVVTVMATIATVVVAVVAERASHQSRLLAQQIELMRDHDETRRYDEQRGERLMSMARDEARRALRWVRMAFEHRPRWGQVGQPAPEIAPERDPAVARLDALTALEQSFVPGAIELALLTDLEMQGRFARIPDAEGFPDSVETHYGYFTSEMRAQAFDWRQERVLDRIRRWGLDPVATAPKVQADLDRAMRDPDQFWDYRLAFPDADLAEWAPDEPSDAP